MWQLQQLQQFKAIHEHGSLSAAARALGISQPAMTRSLQKLEASLGTVLFQRHTRQLRPTEFADALYRQAVRVLNEAAGIDRLVGQLHAGRGGTVRLGCGPYVPDILSHHLVAELQRMGLSIHLDVQTDHFENLCAGLYDYRFDFLVYDARRRKLLPNDSDVVMEPLVRLPLKVVVPAGWLPADHPARVDEGAARAFMAKQPWALPRVAPEYRRYTERWFLDLFLKRRGAEFIMPTISACLGLCRAGHAMTLAPDMLIEDDCKAGLLVTLPVNMGGSVQSSAYRLRSRPLSETAAHVWRLMIADGI